MGRSDYHREVPTLHVLQPYAGTRSARQYRVTDSNEDGWRDLPDGKPLELTIITPNGWSDFNTTAQLISEMLRQVGIRVTPLQPDFLQFNDQLAHADYQLAITNYPQGPTPFKYFDMAFNSTYQAPALPTLCHALLPKPSDR